jgi:hypothetical protein
VAARCRRRETHTAVDITCETTRCRFAASDTANHVTDIRNSRPSSLYQTEVTAAVLGALVDFAGNVKKVVTKIGIVSTSGSPNLPVTISMVHLAAKGTEEILSTVEFYDATKQTGNDTFSGTKESYDVNYEFDVI